MAYKLNILVEDGGVFDGDLDQWQDCFFAFPEEQRTIDCIGLIVSYCDRAGWSVELRFKHKTKEDN